MPSDIIASMTASAASDPDTVRPGSALRFAMAALALAAVFAALTWIVVAATNGVTAFDLDLDSAIHSAAVANPWMVDLSLVLQLVGGILFSGIVVATVLVILLGAGGLRRPFGVRTWTAAFLALSVAGGSLANTVVKSVVGRSRPPWNGMWSYEPTSSYPSAHAQGGITVWVALALVVLITVPGRVRWFVAVPLLILGPAIGVSRTALGVHWPSDVLGGWALGGAWLAASAAVVTLVAAEVVRRRSESGEPAA
jgi:membrane-associated phospholipid phosphatase